MFSFSSHSIDESVSKYIITDQLTYQLQWGGGVLYMTSRRTMITKYLSTCANTNTFYSIGMISSNYMNYKINYFVAYSCKLTIYSMLITEKWITRNVLVWIMTQHEFHIPTPLHAYCSSPPYSSSWMVILAWCSLFITSELQHFGVYK